MQILCSIFPFSTFFSDFFPDLFPPTVFPTFPQTFFSTFFPTFFSTSFPTFFSTFLSNFFLACVASAWNLWAQEKTGAQEGDTSSRAPVLSFAHHFQAPATQATFSSTFFPTFPPTFFSTFSSTFFSTFSRLFFNSFHRVSHTSKAHSYFEMLTLATFHSWLFTELFYLSLKT